MSPAVTALADGAPEPHAVPEPDGHGAAADQLRSSMRHAMARRLGVVSPVTALGRVVQARGTLVEVAGLDARVGDLCELRMPDGSVRFGEVTGLANEGVLLMPHGDIEGLSLGVVVVPLHRGHRVGVGQCLLGRVVNGFGVPIDGRGDLGARQWASVHAPAPDPLQRRMVENRFDTGVRCIDAMLTLGEGQRVGVFAPAGVGKSTLAGMVLRSADVDVCVVALVGERGREVGEFVHKTLGPERMRKSVVVAATSDSPASERVNAGFVAQSIAEWFRDRGGRVLLVVDSVTRMARALREVGLANGEPPTRRGFPPSVFAALPRLMERAGNGAHGSITALYTVLMEGENDDDPIAEEVRSILDGHIVLSRAVAQLPRYPAIDVLASLSRLMPAVADRVHVQAAQRLRALMAKYREVELLIQVGEYRAGSDSLADEAIAKYDELGAFLSQPPDEPAAAQQSIDGLLELMQ